MTAHVRVRLLVVLVATILVSLFVSLAEAQPISISPNEVNAGTSPTLTISASPSFLNLAQLNAMQLEISPANDISNFRIVSATAERLTLSFDLARTAIGGDRALNIKLGDDVTVSLKLVVDRDPLVCSPACVPPRSCQAGRCQLPQ
jgi:hypothetical protein